MEHDVDYWIMELKRAYDGMTEDIPREIIESAGFYWALNCNNAVLFERLTVRNATQLMLKRPKLYNWFGKHQFNYGITEMFIERGHGFLEGRQAHPEKVFWGYIPKALLLNKQFLLTIIYSKAYDKIKAMPPASTDLWWGWVRDDEEKLKELFKEIDAEVAIKRKKRLREILH